LVPKSNFNASQKKQLNDYKRQIIFQKNHHININRANIGHRYKLLSNSQQPDPKLNETHHYFPTTLKASHDELSSEITAPGNQESAKSQ
jgi:hypothetical protein